MVYIKSVILLVKISLLALYPGGIPTKGPPSCEAPREPTIYPLTQPKVANQQQKKKKRTPKNRPY